MTRRLICALFVCGSIGLAMAMVALRPLWYLPEPSVASERQLLHWIALRDLAQHPRSVHVTLVDRFQADVDPRELAQQSQSAGRAYKRYAARIEQNAEILKRVWFETRCQQYADCTEEARYDFLNAQLDAVFEWSAVFAASEGSGAQALEAPGTQTASALLGQIETWIAQASPAEKPNMQRTVHDAAICWLSATDLQPFPAATRRYIAQRISQELGSSAEANNQPLPLALDQQRRLQQNALLLVEAWLNWQAEQYSSLAFDQRSEMIDACLDQVQSWKLDRILTSGDAQSSANVWLQVAIQLPQWLQQVEPPQREQLQAFVAHLQQRFLWRTFRKSTR